MSPAIWAAGGKWKKMEKMEGNGEKWRRRELALVATGCS
jgi:hypothetical protein